MTHVAMIARSYPTPEYKTLGIFEADYAHALAKRGIKVSFIALDMRSFLRKRPLGVHVETKDNLTVYRIDWPLGNLPKGLYYLLAYRALTTIFKKVVEAEGTPDLIHAVFTDYAYLAARLKEDTGIPLYICEPNSHINQDEIDPPLKKAADFAYHTADVVQAVSPRFQEKLHDVFGIDAVNIPILPNLDLFKYNEGPREKKIVCTGRLTEAKGMYELIDAFIAFRKHDPAYTLHIFGDGDAREALQKRIKEAMVDDAVTLHGIVSRETIAKAYETAEFFALCSHHETFGLSYIEAWASGLPVLATKCGGPEHLFTKNNGRDVTVGDTTAIYEAMQEIAHGDFDHAEIARWARTHFSEDKIIGDILSEYEKILQKGAHA